MYYKIQIEILKALSKGADVRQLTTEQNAYICVDGIIIYAIPRNMLFLDCTKFIEMYSMKNLINIDVVTALTDLCQVKNTSVYHIHLYNNDTAGYMTGIDDKYVKLLKGATMFQEKRNSPILARINGAPIAVIMPMKVGD